VQLNQPCSPFPDTRFDGSGFEAGITEDIPLLMK